jgi:hypothetical protein
MHITLTNRHKRNAHATPTRAHARTAPPARARRGDILPTPTDLIDTVRDIVKASGLTLIIEPGRSMVATSSALVNTVTGGRLCACVCVCVCVRACVCVCVCVFVCALLHTQHS